MLSLPNEVSHVYTTYIGVKKQRETGEASEASMQAINAIQDWLTKSGQPVTSESFVGIKLDDSDVQDVAVWVCYWPDPVQSKACLKEISLLNIHADLPAPGRASVGIWQDSFATEVSRLETNYSGLDYLPGLARLPSASTTEHTLSAY